MPADLHCHTTMSDGSCSPEFAVNLAKNSGLSAVALTDHDYYPLDLDADELSKKHSIRVIKGVECSCSDTARGHKVHILCYNCKYPEALGEILLKCNRARTDAVQQMIKKVSAIYPITEEMVMDGVSSSGFCGKQHIMLALMKAGYTNEMFGSLFKKLFSSKTGCCFVPIKHPDVFEAMNYLRESGGVIVMAHPSVYGSIASMEDLIKAGIHGIELEHPRNKPEDKKTIIQAAENQHLLLTGGTDFHGYFTHISRVNPIGSYTASDEQLNALLEKSAQLYAVN